ncbi:MAG: HAD hydrolase family protein [Sandaracinaceae bacterium]
MDVLTIIPARGGSVGVPRKNVRLLGGRPLVAWSIEQAIATPSVTRVVVSTDDVEIASVSRRFGAEVVERPAELATATASSESALAHCLETLRAREGYAPDLVVFLQATSPFRQPGDIQAAIETLVREDADSLFSACPSHGFVWRLHAKGPRSINYDPLRRPRRQDAPIDVIENGSIYVFRPALLEETGSRLGGTIATYPMRAIDSFQVDEPEDLVLMEAILASRLGDEPPAELGRVELLLLDFDGVLTDNAVFVDQGGVESVRCHRGDGWGIARLKDAGVMVEVVSTETNPVVAARCAKLGVACHQAVGDKGALIDAMLRERGLSPASVAFVGNDVNDLGALERVGLPIAVADAVPSVKGVARFVTSARGGHGAVREIADAILAHRAEERSEVRRVA